LRVDSVRAIDLEGMTEGKIKNLWLLPEFKDLDPSVTHLLGVKVCEISDMQELIDELTPEPHIDGDNLPPEGMELGDLQASLAADTAAEMQSIG
jgi:hypothetical protein